MKPCGSLLGTSQGEKYSPKMLGILYGIHASPVRTPVTEDQDVSRNHARTLHFRAGNGGRRFRAPATGGQKQGCRNEREDESMASLKEVLQTSGGQWWRTVPMSFLVFLQFLCRAISPPQITANTRKPVYVCVQCRVHARTVARSRHSKLRR